ncbi:DUF3574 domain-containing protein [Streptomyces sp. NPDC006544]|uniref:DUF3574 domain-containing protein n=1 Tax=Streptomyces sp. NPDC006544 TaxID=3154583 RepID=UPI0033A73656
MRPARKGAEWGTGPGPSGGGGTLSGGRGVPMWGAPREFMHFLDQEITPAFPEGLTVQDGHGQWRGSNGAVVHEVSYEVILLYPRRRPASAACASSGSGGRTRSSSSRTRSGGPTTS